MSQNPYQPPTSQAPPIRTPEQRRLALKTIAQYQKGVIVCILVYFLLVLLQFTIPPDLRFLLGLAVIGLGLVGTVFVFLLAFKVYSKPEAIALGILTIVPCVGIVALLLVNTRATKMLKQNGVQVGFLGANLSKI